MRNLLFLIVALSLCGCPNRSGTRKDAPNQAPPADAVSQPKTESSSAQSAQPTPTQPAQNAEGQSKEPPLNSEASTADQTSTSNVRVPGEPETKNGMVTSSNKGQDAASLPLGSNDAKPSSQASSSQAWSSQAWTKQRMILLSPGGPRLIDIKVNVGGRELEEGFHQAAETLAKDLKVDDSLSWQELLKQPLPSSGWLGNLVPTAEQMDQFLNLYDSNRNAQVDTNEFAPFMTRGLSRLTRLRLGKARSTNLERQSWYGPVDANGDLEVTEEERIAAGRAVSAFDFDGDRVITLGEVRSRTAMNEGMMNSSSSTSMLDTSLVLSLNEQSQGSVVSTLIKHYSFTDTIPTDSFHSWSAPQRSELDRNGDGQYDTTELRQLSEMLPHATLYVTFPDSLAGPATDPSDQSGTPKSIPSTPRLHLEISPTQQGHEQSKSGGGREHPRETTTAWSGTAQAGQYAVDGCLVNLRVSDAYDETMRKRFEQQVQQALETSNVAAMLTAQLELKANAFELLREKPEQAGGLAWNWAVGLREWNVNVTWSQSSNGWFELADANGDQKITESELNELPARLAACDRNRDATLVEDEAPLSVLLVVERADSRGVFFVPGGTGSEKRGANAPDAPTWFQGMDYNSDGELSRAEFLGEEGDFDRLDLNQDGIIEATEVRH